MSERTERSYAAETAKVILRAVGEQRNANVTNVVRETSDATFGSTRHTVGALLRDARIPKGVKGKIQALADAIVWARGEQPLVAPIIRHGRDLHAQIKDRFESLDVEAFGVCMISATRRLLALEIVSVGILDEGYANPREIFRAALKYPAKFVVLVHNHPSGDVTPSSADRELTMRLMCVGRDLDLPVKDHLIIGHNGALYSFEETGTLPLVSYTERSRM